MSTYRDRDGNPIGMEEWAAALHNHRVAKTEIGPFVVSTVWTGLDDGSGNIFESIVFRQGEVESQHRSPTELDALRDHLDHVDFVEDLVGDAAQFPFYRSSKEVIWRMR